MTLKEQYAEQKLIIAWARCILQVSSHEIDRNLALQDILQAQERMKRLDIIQRHRINL